jgi:conjugative transfer signal peptidase TraF
VSRRLPTAGDTPLFAWGDALRAAKLRRKRLVRRGVAIAIISAIALVPAVFPPAPRLVWNASASAPVGLYGVTPGAPAEVGDMVVARLPRIVRQLAAERRYLPANVPLVKRVAAAAGDKVCAYDRYVFVDGEFVAERQVFDGEGRRMPFWLGCTRLRGEQKLLLMDAANSFDGRYFGVTEGSDVIGKAELLWAR